MPEVKSQKIIPLATDKEQRMFSSQMNKIENKLLSGEKQSLMEIQQEAQFYKNKYYNMCRNAKRLPTPYVPSSTKKQESERECSISSNFNYKEKFMESQKRNQQLICKIQKIKSQFKESDQELTKVLKASERTYNILKNQIYRLRKQISLLKGI